MKALKIAMFLPLVGFVPAAANAEPQDQMALVAHAKKPRYKVARPRYLPPAEVVPVVAPVPVYVARPYDWSGIYVGAYGGLSGFSRGPDFQYPTYGTLQGNEVGFAGSNQTNSVGVLSQTYNSFSNQIVGNGVQVGTATSAGNSYVNGPNPGAVGVSATVTETVIPYNNGVANQTQSQFASHFDNRKLAGILGGELGYRKQVGSFVFGVAVDGGIISGQESHGSNSQGSFFNDQGVRTSGSQQGCYASNGDGTCGDRTALTSSGSVDVQNSGHSSSSLTVKAGPQWLGTARLTGGFAMDRVLLYATGGFAYAQSSISVQGSYHDNVNSTCSGIAQSSNANVGITTSSYNCNGAGSTNTAYNSSTDATFSGYKSRFMPGYSIGGGVGYALTDHITLNLEGMYYSLGTLSTTVSGSGSQTASGNNANGGFVGTRAVSVSSFSVSQKIDGIIAKAGIQFKFDTGTPDPIYPVVAARY